MSTTIFVTTIFVKSETRDRINRLKGVFNCSSADEVIQQMLFRLGYNELFFQRLDALKVVEGEKEE